MNINIGIHNRFDIEVIDAKTGKIKQKAQAHNVILDNLWTTLLGNNMNKYFQYIYWGSGTGTPDHTDTQLFHHEGLLSCGSDNGVDDCTYTCDHINGVSSCQRMVQLSEQTSVGVTITEVGIGNGDTTTGLCTHALLEDMNGNPISILKTNVDIINIYATVFVHWSQIGMFYPDRNYTYSGTKRGAFRGWVHGTYKYGSGSNKDCYPGSNIYFAKESYGTYMGYNNIEASYTSVHSQNDVTVTRDISQRKLMFSVARYAVAEGNMGGIGNIWMCSQGGVPSIKVPVSSFYSGDDITDEAVGTGDGTTTRFKLKFDYPTQAKIYVNGVEQSSGVTVRNIPANTLELKQAYVKILLGSSTDANNIQSPEAEYHNDGYSDRSKYPLKANGIIRNMLNDVGFASVKGNESLPTKVYGSNDLTNWTLIYDRADQGIVNLDSTTGHFKYYKTNQRIQFTWNSEDFKAVVFDTAPSVGDVITADYHTPYIAKDSDHVFDLSYTLTFGEYTE